jgi:hydrogenase nickel incorporation protein HypB
MPHIPVVEHILAVNEDRAAAVRDRLDAARVYGVNFMASPGAGKTSVITRTVEQLQSRLRAGYVDGDIATSIDAERVARLGAPVVQINTGGDCHLDANMLDHALHELPLANLDYLIVENVGNLICPSNFRLGVHLNVLIASVPEGDDKPYKYPSMYRGVDVLILNKIDLLPYIPFDPAYFMRGVRVLNPEVVIFQLSALYGDKDHATVSAREPEGATRPEGTHQVREGFSEWTRWLSQRVLSHVFPTPGDSAVRG